MNEIIISKQNGEDVMTLVGGNAYRLHVKNNYQVPRVTKLDESEKFHVFNVDGTHLAAQPTKELAMKYMTESSVLVYREESKINGYSPEEVILA